MGEPTEREKILAVIKKLLNMAEHSASNEHEALAAASRAEALMRKHNIQYAEAIKAEIKSGAGVVSQATVATAKDNGTATKQTPPWAQQIAVRVAELFDAPVRLDFIKTTKGYESAIRFHGYEHDVRVAVWTFDVLIATVNRLCKVYRKHPHYLLHGRTVMNAYRMGMVHSITNKIHQMVQEKELAEAQELAAKQLTDGTASTSTALVWIKRKAIDEKFGKFVYRQAKAPNIKNATAYHTGREDGRKVDIQSAITSTTSKALNS